MKKEPQRISMKTLLRKNGFYIALVICVIAAAVASYAAVDKILENFTKENNDSARITDISPLPEDDSSHVSENTENVVRPKEKLTTVETQEPVSTAEPFVAVYSKPVDGKLTNMFSGGELAKNKTMNDWRTHNGVDIEAAEGTKVVALYSGEIIRSGKDELWGYFAELKLDTGYTAIYKNLAPITGLTAGKRLSQGDVLGQVGTSSIIEGAEPAHLHLEIKSGDNYIDPDSLF
ncbi:MAG: M23 family metallopeptidase [Oscillospiraceae bacterium]